MIVSVNGSGLKGSIRVPESKSHAHRALICSALSGNPSRIICEKTSADIDATASCLNALGAVIERTYNGFSISGLNKKDSCILDCNESGSTYRFMVPVACALSEECTFLLRGRLPYRPMEPVFSNLKKHGITITGEGSDAVTLKGRLTSGRYSIRGDISSQYITGLLFALPLLDGDSLIEIKGELQSESYINITLKTLSDYGIIIERKENTFCIAGGQKYIAPEKLVVEADWSNGAFWLSAGALSDNGITCLGLDSNSPQGDKRIIEILSSFGAEITEKDNAVTVKAGCLKGIELDAGDIPDLVPVISVVAAFAQGKTYISNAGRLRLKESDRLETVSHLLNALGGRVTEYEDALLIEGVPLKGGRCSSFNDHRIAMSLAVASVGCAERVVIEGAEAVNKSYPAFYDD